ncbi:hypothetical protein VTN77DRAFT_5178 [Rasamsonia byssochlamydoides]|uniref:uncharacterized protein n=1 Tax=Rasamsonia byssochlamydoides TaxID=89139 RepID=UPI0037444639
MSSDYDTSGYDVAASRRERPWQFLSNRKLRHLQGVSVRNLYITPPNRARGKTIDDDDLPNALKSPAKFLAQAESRSVHHSRSYTDLQLSHSKLNLTSSDNEKNTHDARRLRRRNTLPWSGGNLEIRQTQLEDITKSRMADTWFSIHCDGIDNPVYISEVVEKATNPSFRFFDLNACGPHVSRLDEMTLKLWVKSANMSEYMLLVELQLSLRSLQFVGKTLDNFHQPLPPNSILFHFADGVYTNLTDLPPVQPAPSAQASEGISLRGDVQTTSSYDALMRLANLDDCIQDALATRDRLEAQINAILEKNQRDLETISQAGQAQEKISLTRRAIAAEKKQLRGSIKRKEELISSINARKNAMAEGRESQDKARSHLPDAQLTMASRVSLLEKNIEESKGQIRRICEDLLAIYPIEPIPGKALAFTIAGLALPNSSFEDIDRDAVAAALGYTAHLVYLLSFYLSAPIPYPVKPYLSHSIIHDPVSVALPQRTFPLYPVNVQYRFEYGVFLLNKDIEFLMNRRGLRALDIRHTLPNLKYLLYVLTAGTSELPARKAGGVRGLLMGRQTPTLSRQASEDSIASGELVNPRRFSDTFWKVPANNDTDKGKRPVTDSVHSFATSSTNTISPARTSVSGAS